MYPMLAGVSSGWSYEQSLFFEFVFVFGLWLFGEDDGCRSGS